MAIEINDGKPLCPDIEVVMHRIIIEHGVDSEGYTTCATHMECSTSELVMDGVLEPDEYDDSHFINPFVGFGMLAQAEGYSHERWRNSSNDNDEN